GEDGSTLTDMTQCTSSPQVSRVPLGLSQPAWNDEGILPFSSQIFEPKQRRWQSRERSCSIEARLVKREVAGKGLTPGQGTPAELEGCKERRDRTTHGCQWRDVRKRGCEEAHIAKYGAIGRCG